MNYNEIDFYVKRVKKGSHTSTFAPIKRAKKLNPFMREVFGHHIAVYDGVSALAQLPGLNYDGENGFRNKDVIHSLFYSKYYVANNLYSGATVEEHNNEILDDEFCERITYYGESDKNNLFFLLGRIGCGKTAFINKILTERAKDWFNSKRIFFIRVGGLHRKLHSPYSCSELLTKLIEKTIRIEQLPSVVNHFESDVDVKEAFRELIAIVENPNDFARTLSFTKVIRLVRKKLNIRFLFVIDNIDYILHTDDMKIFLPELIEHTLTFAGVDHFISLFVDNDLLGQVGVNILFVMRPDSYEILREGHKTDNVHPWEDMYDDSKVYSLGIPSLADILHERLGMIEELHKCLPTGQQSYIHEIVQPLATFIDGKGGVNPELMSILPNLANYGLRDITEFCVRYAWVAHEGAYKAGMDRFTGQFGAGLIAFILKGYKMFSQFSTGFPNIYLTGTPKEVGLSDDMPHYYWLKRLLIEYIYLRNSKNLSVNLTDILRKFSSDKGYPEKLVRCVLACFGRVHKSNIIQTNFVGYQDKINITEIMLTDRGRTCYKEKLFDKFLYFQLVIEDFQLHLPNNDTILNLFSYSERDYSYLVATDIEYGEILRLFVRDKAQKVLFFLQMLKYELEYERKRFSQTFEKLRNEGISINFGMTYQETYEDLKGIFKFLEMEDTELAKMVDFAKSIGEEVVAPMYEKLLETVQRQE